METVCQLSYPLNSENASPFGTRTVYLAWPVSCAEVALLPRTASTERASDSTTITTAGILLLFIASPRCLLVASMGLMVRRSLARTAGRVKHHGTVTGRRRLRFSISATRSSGGRLVWQYTSWARFWDRQRRTSQACNVPACLCTLCRRDRYDLGENVVVTH